MTKLRELIYGPNIQHPLLGELRRGKSLTGQMELLPWEEPVELVIEVGKGRKKNPDLHTAELFKQQYQSFVNRLLADLYEDYLFYKKTDLEECGVTEKDYAEYPPVKGPEDIPAVFVPYMVQINASLDKYTGNAYIIFDVKWPNPHALLTNLLVLPQEIKTTVTDLAG
ncbi:MAG: hypothetical protein GY757_05445 [bacterium]|nr:hypothetical protein [bacterium]